MLSQNPNITFDIVMDTIDDLKDAEFLRNYRGIYNSFYDRFGWEWYNLSQNPNITFDNVMKTIDNKTCKWNLSMLSKNDMSRLREKYISNMPCKLKLIDINYDNNFFYIIYKKYNIKYI